MTIKARLSATTRSVHTHRTSCHKRETVRSCLPRVHPRGSPSLCLFSERPALQFTVYVDGLMLPAACTARLASLRYQPSTPTRPPSIILAPVLWCSPRPSFFVDGRGRRQQAVDRSASKAITPQACSFRAISPLLCLKVEIVFCAGQRLVGTWGFRL